MERGGTELFANLSFMAQPGAHVALTGRNGAGKTSLLRALAGFLKPSAGAIRFDCGEDAPRHTHFLGHRDGLKGALDVREHVIFWRDLLGGAGDADAALKRVGLSHICDLPARALSAGQGRRLSIARLLVAPRAVWLLDEPAAALDTAGKALLAGIIDEHRAGGGVVIAAVHEPLGAPDSEVRIGA
ncbi:MAG: heme ABC exporter ATP-binding protein CcmA [Hyphomonadaceae bacterium]|nr:heme ABC exporter ATP-binding protein CcmA [Hyphomonadaceae bacterium]